MLVFLLSLSFDLVFRCKELNLNWWRNLLLSVISKRVRHIAGQGRFLTRHFLIFWRLLVPLEGKKNTKPWQYIVSCCFLLFPCSLSTLNCLLSVMISSPRSAAWHTKEMKKKQTVRPVWRVATTDVEERARRENSRYMFRLAQTYQETRKEQMKADTHSTRDYPKRNIIVGKSKSCCSKKSCSSVALID